MATKGSHIETEIATLRRVQARLIAELEPLEEWRALRELDEREKAGAPHEPVDGVLIRGRLVKQLAARSRAWRAYVMVEAAVAELAGSEETEPALFVRSVTTPDAWTELPATSDKRVVPVRPASPAAVPEPVAAASDGPTTFVAKAALQTPSPDSADPSQRMRVKVRAESVAIPASVAKAATITAAPGTTVPTIGAPAYRSGEAASAQPRGALDRIRAIDDVEAPGKCEAPLRPAGIDTAIWGARETPAPAPEFEAPVGEAVPHASMPTAGVSCVPPAVSPAIAGGAAVLVRESALSQREATDLVAKEARMQAVETAIDRLADAAVGNSTVPLDNREARKRRLAAAPDAADLGKDLTETTAEEAEVVIVAGPQATVAARDMAREAPALPSNQRPAKQETDADPDGHGGHWDVEEASVEIIVPPGTGARPSP